MINKWSVRDYDTATIWLQEGRKKNTRPLYMRGLHMTKINNGDIVITDKWSQFNPVIFHPNGTKTIQAPVISRQWGSWDALRSQTVRYNILQFSGIAQIYQKNFKCHLVFQDALTTAPKIQGCKTCRQTGKVDSWCSASYCYQELPCESHPDAQPRNANSNWHIVPCEHNVFDGHQVKQGQQCYYCNGTGKRDYGSKLISLIWDGSPLRIKDGSLVKQPPTELEKRIAAYVQPIS